MEDVNTHAKKGYRIIFHIDMNCFFASCEVANNPSLKGKPIVVAHDEPMRKSIVLTASYEARKYGIKTTMLTREAIKLCPKVVIVEPKYELYSKYSKLFFDFMSKITKKSEAMSIDEGLFDVTETYEKIHPVELAKYIQKTLYEKYQLPCSIGIAPNKFLAKMASDMKKPMGITVLRKKDIPTLLWPLKIEDMIGVGKKTAPRLHEIGIHTIGDLANFKDDALLERTVGSAMKGYLKDKSLGIDSSEVIPIDNDDYSSVSNSQTFEHDVNNITIIKDMLKNLCNSVCHRLEKHGLLAKTFGVQIKYNNFELINRSRGLNNSINDSFEAWKVVEGLFDDNYDETRYIRLIGVFANRIEKESSKPKQYTLFDDLSAVEKENSVKKLLDKINNNLGDGTIKIGARDANSKTDEESKKLLFKSN